MLTQHQDPSRSDPVDNAQRAVGDERHLDWIPKVGFYRLADHTAYHSIVINHSRGLPYQPSALSIVLCNEIKRHSYHPPKASRDETISEADNMPSTPKARLAERAYDHVIAGIEGLDLAQSRKERWCN